MNKRTLAALSAFFVGFGIVQAQPAEATVTSYTRTVSVTCNGHALKVWGTFNSDSSNGRHRGARGGFDASSAEQLYNKVSVYSYGAGAPTVANLGAVIHGSAYSTGAWHSSAAYVLVIPYVNGKPCNNGYGYTVND